MSCYSADKEITSICGDFLVERRGFETLTSAVQAPARLTGSSLPFLVGDVGVCATTRTFADDGISALAQPK
jgi:hypothetical protein